ncbi:DUF2344 domain-containing protein [candidate division WOR-3 bacterium]|nr:DUF2344 domain-containing protein [candidate division WOR-3 bacterium]
MGSHGPEVVKNDLDDILRKVEHPTRYIGSEFHSVNNPEDALVLLCYPDIYEIGMSNLGLQILRRVLLNNGYGVERVYCPAQDLEKALLSGKFPLFSLESRIPVSDFSVLGFSLECELDITNIINILFLGGIPVSRLDRSDGDPVVIAGGASVLNPSPWSHFIDAFVIGEAEDVILHIACLARQYRQKLLRRTEFVEELSRLKGVYVPGITNTDVEYLRVEELKYEQAPLPPLLPHMQIIHDRHVVEITRGCARSCKFCQAGCVSRKVRHRNAEDVVRIAKEGLESTGWEELSLLSLSVSDHPELGSILGELFPYLKKNHIFLSLPSLRADSVSEETLRIAGILGHRTLTLAPEAGNESLRSDVGKTMKDNDIFSSIEKALRNSFSRIKFYFMVGLPGETDRDVEDIADLAIEISKAMKKNSFKISIAPFVPRPHTPFETCPQSTPEEITGKYRLISEKLKKIRRFVNFRDPRTAAVEGIIARGGHEISTVAVEAFRKGSRFDQWIENFSFDVWRSSMEKAGIDFSAELRNTNGGSGRWDKIRTGSRSDFFNVQRKNDSAISMPVKSFLNVTEAEETIFHYRLKYSKELPLRFISHLELTTAVLRSLKRAGIKMPYTKGKRPKPAVNFGPPLPCGAVSNTELLDFSSTNLLEKSAHKKLQEHFPVGISPLDIFFFEKSHPPITSSELEIKYLCRNYEADRQTVEDFFSKTSCTIERNTKGRKKTLDMKKYLMKIENTCEGTVFSVIYNSTGSVRPAELEKYFGIEQDTIWERTEIIQR